jgi:hypothetical protein
VVQSALHRQHTGRCQWIMHEAQPVLLLSGLFKIVIESVIIL